MTKHQGTEIESILISQAEAGQASCQLWSGNGDLPGELSLQPAYRRLDVTLEPGAGNTIKGSLPSFRQSPMNSSVPKP